MRRESLYIHVFVTVLAVSTLLSIGWLTANAGTDKYAPPEKSGLPPSDMKLNMERTALLVTDPQIDFLSPKGATWAIVGESVNNQAYRSVEGNGCGRGRRGWCWRRRRAGAWHLVESAFAPMQ